MQDDLKQTCVPDSAEPELDKFLDQLRTEVIGGLHHGFFEGTILIETRRADRREVLLKAGKSHKFTIPTDELPR